MAYGLFLWIVKAVVLRSSFRMKKNYLDTETWTLKPKTDLDTETKHPVCVDAKIVRSPDTGTQKPKIQTYPNSNWHCA